MYCSGNKICSICAGKRWEIMGIKNMGLTAGRITNTLLNASMKNFHNAKVKMDHVNIADLISGNKVTNELAYSSDGNSIIINVPYAEAYIPDEIVGDPTKGNPVAYQYGEGIRAIGLFNIRFFSNEDESRDKPKLCVFKYPNEITMYPTDRETKTLKLDKNLKEDKYLILKFYQGDVIMSANIEKKSQKCESFMNQLIMGKLPKGLSYDELYFSWEKNFKINGINSGVPAITKQMIISENCRVAGDPSKQFRKIVNNPNVTLYDYEVHNMVDICANSSVMNALIFERFGDMVTSSLNMTKEGISQNTTPLEEVLYV